MNKGDLVSVIVPGLNEAQSIRELYGRITRVFEKLGRPFEFIFIDDGSSDATLDILKDLQGNHSNVGFVSHFLNLGKSFALMQGFDMAEGEVAVLMDADLQDQPEDIPAFLDELNKGFDLVNGWRHQRKDTATKRFVSQIYNKIIKSLFKLHIHDVNCGFKACRKAVYKRLTLRGDLHRLIPVLAASGGFRISEIKVRHEDRKYGESRYKLLRINGLLDLFTLMAANTSQLRPFHVFTYFSVFFWILVAIFMALWLMTEAGGKLNLFLFILMAWCALTGTLMPLFGFLLEVLTSVFQGKQWRMRYIKTSSHPPVHQDHKPNSP